MARDTLIEGSTLTAIADAIREKTETTDVMYPSEMAGKIRGIEAGGIPIPNPIAAGDTVVKTSSLDTATSTSKTTVQASGVYITIAKAGTYRFKYTLTKNAAYANAYSQLYKNGTVISGTEVGKSSTVKNFEASNDVACGAGDTIEIYYRGGTNSDSVGVKCTVSNFTAGVELDFSYFN